MKSIRTIVIFFLSLFATSFLPLFSGEDYNGNEYNMLYESHFETDGVTAPWKLGNYDGSADSILEAKNGELVVTVLNPGVERWGLQVFHDGLTFKKDQIYTVGFKIRAEQDCRVYTRVGLGAEPYTEFWSNDFTPFDIIAGQEFIVEQTFVTGFENDEEEGCNIAFNLGGDLGVAGNKVYIDDVYLLAPYKVDKPIFTEAPKRAVRVNQVGYFTEGKKSASVVNESPEPLQWGLVNAEGTLVEQGTTSVFGRDSASNDFIHMIDFSGFSTAGAGYKLVLPDLTDDLAESYHFSISNDLYSTLKYDALAYFYHNRSGVEISMPYAGREDLTRPAGHVGILPNQGDLAVPTWPESGQKEYTLDVSGGWYDAGDHGKYVVNGGISLWTMQNQYERLLYGDARSSAAFEDGKMNIPEQGNGHPDILDEARWEMEFFLKMQVPESADPDLAGMVHLKIHDETWTGMALAPHEDDRKRYLRPVTTTATLNFAAAGAQASRLWKEYDPSFALVCLEAAEKAWNAALEHPDMLPDGFGTGGGAYGDTDVSDEFYWAACELYLSTGKEGYKNYLSSSAHYLKVPKNTMGWQGTAGMGTLSLVLVDNEYNQLSEADRALAKTGMKNLADSYLAIMSKEGYCLPWEGSYYWGSNSEVMNRAILLAAVYDFSGEQVYLDGVVQSMDYLLGRNAMDVSYVTGYGENAYKNPHHRHWSHSLDSAYPTPPAGSVSGGPNGSFQDPVIKAKLPVNTPPQKCYVDDLESYSTNEVAINWNSPLAWLAAFLDDVYNKTEAETCTLTVESGTGSGEYKEGEVVEIIFLPPPMLPGYRLVFEGWSGDSEYVADPSQEITSVTMPAKDILITAQFSVVMDPKKDITIEYVMSSWDSGFCVNIILTNNSGADINGWTLDFVFPDGQIINSAWCCNWSQNGEYVSMGDMGWNAVIPDKGSVTLGFVGAHNGVHQVPTEFFLNGTLITVK